VKDDDGSVEGCHATEQEANDQMAALYASEPGAEPGAEDAVVQSVYTNGYPLPAEAYSLGKWRGVLAVEEVETGDGRLFVENALVWRDLPLTIDWQPKTAEEHEQSVIVARLETITRDGVIVRGEGTFDMAEGSDGAEAHRLVHAGMLRGLSVTLDDISDQDIEMIWPEEDDEMGDGLDMLFAMPELIKFHHGRIMGALLTHQPALQEAYLELVPDDENAAPAASGSPSYSSSSVGMFTVVAPHTTDSTDEPWDAGLNEARLPSPMTYETARNAYAWVDGSKITDGQVEKASCEMLHHHIGTSGTPGRANVTALAAAIGKLNGASGGSGIPAGDRQAVYDHLAQHMRDGGREPEPLSSLEEAEQLKSLTAALTLVADPPIEWFRNPGLRTPTPFTICDDGRTYGHLAVWGTCHTSFTGQCITPPREDDFAYFTTGELVTREKARVPVGVLTFGTNHAPIHLGARPAVEHYEHTGHVAADVACGADKHGIWVAGAVRPDLTEGQMRALRASAPSGDWRRIGGRMRLMAALLVNVPGFPIPRMKSFAHDGVQTALVASGVYRATGPKSRVPDAVVDRIARSIGRDKMSRLHERVHPR